MEVSALRSQALHCGFGFGFDDDFMVLVGDDADEGVSSASGSSWIQQRQPYGDGGLRSLVSEDA